jgi:hypothetical protein
MATIAFSSCPILASNLSSEASTEAAEVGVEGPVRVGGAERSDRSETATGRYGPVASLK